MRIRRLQTRFVLTGGLLVALTVGCGIWSAAMFAHLSRVVDRSLRDSQETIDLASSLTGILEVEDEELEIALKVGTDQAKQEVLRQRRRFNEVFNRLDHLLRGDDEKEAAADLDHQVAEYRRAANDLLNRAGAPGTIDRYLRDAKPLYRKAVDDYCARLRELSLRSLRLAGERGRDFARWATGIVVLISLGALLLSTIISIRLARSVVGPVRELTNSLEAVTRGNFDRRLPERQDGELGQLAHGFNQMVQTLADYRNSSLGELLQAKTTLEATLTAMPDAVFIIDPDGRLVSFSPRARAILRAAGRDKAQTVAELPLTPEGLRLVRDALERQAAPASRFDWTRVLPVELEGRTARFTLGVAPVPHYWPGRHGAVVVLADVTDFVRVDELRTELIAVASHELKTPLTALRMNLMLLGEELRELTPRLREILQAALAGSEELGNTIDELLDLTRIEAGQLRLDFERVDLTALAGRVVTQARQRFDDKGVVLQFLPETEATVRGDAARLRIVLDNLLSNALKYTPPGGRVTVTVSSLQNAGPASEQAVQIAVTDTGAGIPVEFRERIFDKFFRVEHHRPGTAEGVRGVGIGLYLCRQIVEAHHGRIICLAGEGGRGTQIAVELHQEIAHSRQVVGTEPEYR